MSRQRSLGLFFALDSRLTFDWRAAWDMRFYGASLNRQLDFVVEPGGGGTPLQTTNLVTTDFAATIIGCPV